MDDIVKTAKAGSLQCTLNLPQGPIRADLSIMDLGSDEGSGDTRFIVGLEILDEFPRRPPSCGLSGPSRDNDEARWAHVVSVPEESPLQEF